MKLTQAEGILAFLAICSEAAFSAQVDVESRSLDEIYAAAKKEDGTLQVFWGGDDGTQGNSVRSAWKEAFPDIKLNLTVDLSKYHDNRIDRAHQQGIHVADVAVIQTLQDFPRWKQEGKLLKYKPATFEDLLETEKDPDGAFVPTSIISFGTFTYDNTKVNSSIIPNSYASLTDPRFQGKLILTYPNDDDAVAYLFSLIVGRYGFQWLYDLAQNDVKWVRGTGTPASQLADLHNTTSQRSITFTSYSRGQSFFSTKAPVAPEQYMSWAQTGGIIAGTPMPESSKLFISWLTSRERQTASSGGGLSVLNSVNEANGVSPYGNNATQITRFRLFEQDRANVEWWKNLFEEVLGTPQGKGPLEVYPNP